MRVKHRIPKVNCPFCGSDENAAFHLEKIDSNAPHGYYYNRLWYNCNHCGTVFTVEDHP